MTAADGMISAALRLLSLGFAPHWLRGPVGGSPEGRGKAPVLPAWQKQACLQRHVLCGAYRHGNNLGIHAGYVERCPVPVVVIDCDSADGLAWCLQQLPQTQIVTNTRAGRHLFYRHPGPNPDGVHITIPNRCNVNGLGIDIRGDAGNVVCAPSRHTSGSLYSEAVEWTPARVAAMPVYDPAWFPARPDHALPPLHMQAMADALTRASKWLALRDPAISGQHGQTWTFKTAGHLIHNFGLSENETLDLLQREWNHRCVPPWPIEGNHGLRRKVAEAAKASWRGR